MVFVEGGDSVFMQRQEKFLGFKWHLVDGCSC